MSLEQNTGLPFSPACERNKAPILHALKQHFAGRRRVLELGSGTGQHAVHFAETMPWLVWQASDRAENLPSIKARIDQAGLPNTPPPIRFDVNDKPSLSREFDAAFSANTLHIMSWLEVERCFSAIDELLGDDASLAIYGPFLYGGAFTSPSNAAFDESLKSRDPRMGIRDFADVDALARAAGFRLEADIAMPANNQTLIWRRGA